MTVGIGAGVVGAFASYFLMMPGVLAAGIMGFAITAGIMNLLGIDNSYLSSLVGSASAVIAVWLTRIHNSKSQGYE